MSDSNATFGKLFCTGKNGREKNGQQKNFKDTRVIHDSAEEKVQSVQ